jgi:hypothetical protein
MNDQMRVEEVYSGLKKNRIASRFALGPVSLQFVTIILLALFSLMYLLQNNQMTTQGYKIAQLKNEQLDILQENEKYQVEAARLKALDKVKEQVKNVEMETVTSVKYLAVQK